MTPIQITEPDATQIAGILAQMPSAAKLMFLDKQGNPLPVTTAFDAMTAGTGSSGDLQWPWANLPVLANDPARIIFSSTLPAASLYYVAPSQPDGYTVGQMVTALGSPAPLACGGLFSTLNSGDVPTNTDSPISYALPFADKETPVLVDVHGVYVDFGKSRVLLTQF
jgi:hypothetical protein